MSARSAEPVIIGWSEYIDLPDWDIKGLRVKIDTGARSSALHVDGVEELPRGFVAFDVVLHRAKRDRRVRVRARVSRRGRVRSSTGHLTHRIFVETTMRLGPVEKKIEISLVDRERMIHRMLLGRTALTGPFLIDVDRRNEHKPRRRKPTATKAAKRPAAPARKKSKKRSRT